MTNSAPQNLLRGPVRVSVLMSTYARESARHLDEALASLIDQTVSPDEIVLVIDGPIGDEQERIISRYERSAVRLIVVRKAINGGLAQALNSGLEHCRGRYIMRMDADDVCEPDRVALQLSFLEKNPDVDLLGSWVREFSDDKMISGVKASPCHHDELAMALRFRNLITHPTVVMRRDKLVGLGAYHTKFGLLEDYDLFVRFVEAGARLHVIPKVLVRVRTSLSQRARRGGVKYFWNELAFRYSCLKRGFLTPRQFLLTTLFYGTFRLVGPLRQRLYSLART